MHNWQMYQHHKLSNPSCKSSIWPKSPEGPFLYKYLKQTPVCHMIHYHVTSKPVHWFISSQIKLVKNRGNNWCPFHSPRSECSRIWVNKMTWLSMKVWFFTIIFHFMEENVTSKANHKNHIFLPILYTAVCNYLSFQGKSYLNAYQEL